MAFDGEGEPGFPSDGDHGVFVNRGERPAAHVLDGRFDVGHPDGLPNPVEYKDLLLQDLFRGPGGRRRRLVWRFLVHVRFLPGQCTRRGVCEWSPREELHLQGYAILNRSGLLFPVSHAAWWARRGLHLKIFRFWIGPVCCFPVSQLPESGACGENRTRTGDVLNVVPLLLGYASMVPRARIAPALADF